MEGSFACPECGESVELAGLAPGRHVRCRFCHRLLEVPYLPRATDTSWKRRRFQKPGWVVWAWSGLGIAAVVIGGTGALAVLKRHQHSSQEKSIRNLLESSRRHESSGRLTEALLDLDAALAIAAKSDVSIAGSVQERQKRRADLAIREAQSVKDGLSHAGSSPFPLGDWLNLVFRAERDSDLTGIVPDIKKQFQQNLAESIAAQLARARKSIQAGQVVTALETCDEIAKLIKHLSPGSSAAIRREAENLVAQLLAGHGIQIELPQGEFTFGSQAVYVKEFVPVLTRALEAKGYLPYRESSPWKALWERAGYRMHLQVVEQLEGSYLSSANRLTRIVADLTLSSGGQVRWHTSPSARSTVPLPKLSALVAGRVAAGAERIDEFERMLYADARSHIDEKFGFALSNMPQCPSGAGPG
jgi:hypothetical protein